MFGAAPAANNGKKPLPTVQIDGAPNDSISCLKFSPAGCPINVLGCTSWDGSVRAWQVHNNNGQGLSSVPIAMKDAQVPQLCMSLSQDGKVFHGGVDRKVTMWDLQSQSSQQVAQHDLAVSAVQYCGNGGAPMLVTGSWDGTVAVWDLRSSAPVKKENFGSPIFAIDAQDSFPLAVFALGRKAIVYDLSRMVMHSEVAAHNLSKFHMRAVAAWPDKSAFCCGYAEGRISCHSLAPSTASYNCCFKAHSVDLGNNKFVFHQTNFVRPLGPRAPQVAISGGGDGLIKVWRVSTKTKLYDNDPVLFNGTPIPVSAGDVSADGSILAYGLSYDWGMGKDGFNPNMPRQIHLAYIQPEWQ